MSDREIQYIEVAGRTILAHLAICPECKVLDLNSTFAPSESLDGLIVECSKGHSWEITKSQLKGN